MRLGPKKNKFAVPFRFDYVNEEYWDPMVPISTIPNDQVHEWMLLGTCLNPFYIHLYHMQIATQGGCGEHEEGEFYDTISARATALFILGLLILASIVYYIIMSSSTKIVD